MKKTINTFIFFTRITDLISIGVMKWMYEFRLDEKGLNSQIMGAGLSGSPELVIRLARNTQCIFFYARTHENIFSYEFRPLGILSQWILTKGIMSVANVLLDFVQGDFGFGPVHHVGQSCY